MVVRLLVLLAVSICGSTAASGGWNSLSRPSTSTTVEEALGGVALAALAAVVLWTVAVATLDRLRHKRGAVGRTATMAWHLLVPATMRLAATTAFSIGAVTAGGVPAAAMLSPAFASDVGSPADTTLPQLSRPSTSAPAASTPEPTTPAERACVTVMPGDSLWRIAARHMGPSASTPAIAAEWPRWYAANRARIGPDPNLIIAGTSLLMPVADRGGR